jgi:hypothetical protein
MIRLVLVGLAIVASAAAACLLCNTPAQARPQFKEMFDERYMREGTALFKAYEGKSHCNVCHLNGAKGIRTAYGNALDELLDLEDAKALTPSEMRKDLAKARKAQAKIKAAFEEVEKRPSIPKMKKKSPTFGELIKSGKLPK